MIFQPGHFETYSLINFQFSREMCQILAAAINSADARAAVNRTICRDGDRLVVDKSIYRLSDYTHIYLLGVGKAALPMTEACCQILGEKITNALLITTDGSSISPGGFPFPDISILHASHPVPEQRNIDAAEKLTSFAANFSKDDLVLFLLSGGGSALLTKPRAGLSLHDIQTTTSILLKSGATIGEVNTIRKHLDVYKGGGLARYFYPATILTLVLSDVIGDPLDVIASGPTVPDPTTFVDAKEILSKYNLLDETPPQVLTHILSGCEGKVPETCKRGDLVFEHVANIIIGNNSDAIKSAHREADKLGFSTQLFSSSLQGEASLIGKEFATYAISLAHNRSNKDKPTCIIAGGETTVTIHGTGIGGRNQELVLGAVPVIAGLEQCIMVSLATDGIDGPTDAAGAVATNSTQSRGQKLGQDPRLYLEANDSYTFFSALDDLIKIGPTLTNVNDLVLFFAP